MASYHHRRSADPCVRSPGALMFDSAGRRESRGLNRRCLAEPPTGRRARNPEVRGDGRVPRALHEIPKPVVVALLKASHRMIIGRSLTPLNYSRTLRAVRRRETVRRSDDNSRRKVQNVRGVVMSGAHPVT